MVYMFDFHEYNCRRTPTYEPYMNMWSLYDRSLLFKYWICYCVLWCNLVVWSIVLNALYVSFSWLEVYCICVVVLWWMVLLMTMLFLLCYLGDWYVQTHFSCITISVISSWCELKGSFSYSALSTIMHVKYMTNEVWSCGVLMMLCERFLICTNTQTWMDK